MKDEELKGFPTEEQIDFVIDLKRKITLEKGFCTDADIYLAGLKAGRPQWHTPNVPTSPINKVVLGYIKDCNSKKLCLVEWNGEWWYDANTYNDRVKVIDWCEIPTFDKE